MRLSISLLSLLVFPSSSFLLLKPLNNPICQTSLTSIDFSLTSFPRISSYRSLLKLNIKLADNNEDNIPHIGRKGKKQIKKPRFRQNINRREVGKSERGDNDTDTATPMGSNSDQVSRSTRVLANCRPSPPSSIPSLPSSTIATIESKLLAKFGRRNLDVVDVKKYLNNNGSNSGRKNKGGSGKGGKPWDWKNEGESEGNNLGWSDGANGDDDWKDIEDDDENIKEYYDEDDEGYEGIKEERKKGNGGEWEEELEGVLGGGGGIFGRKKSSGRDTQIKAKSGKDSDDVVVEGNEVKSKIKELKKKPKPEVKPIMIDCKGRDMILNIPYATKCIEEEAERSRMGEGIGFQIPSPTWESVGMNDGELRDKIVALGYGKPLQCQTEAYPVIGEGTKDCVINAHTGAGKTLAFLAPVIERIRRGDFGEGKGVKVIVLAPGRELCSQITDVANGVVEGTGVKVMMCIGGTGYERTVERFRKGRPDIVVGTPGRVAEMIIGKGGKKGCLKVVDVGVVVMDEVRITTQS